MQLINAFQYLEKSAADHPDKIAVFDDTNSYTYKQFFDYSCSVGLTIYKTVNTTRSRIVVMVDRNALSLIGIFSVLAAGSCYVPIDSKMPFDRMDNIISQVNPGAIVYCKKDEASVSRYSADFSLICIDNCIDANKGFSLLEEARETVLDIDPAYMIFTSGSTGNPKGIMISHRSLIDFTEWMTDYCEINSDSVMANQAPFYFDLSVKDIYQTVKNAASLYVIPKKDFSFPLLLIKALNDNSVNTLIWATSAFRLVADSHVLEKAIPMDIKKIILGGEALQSRHVNIWKKHISNLDIINLYGPTEVTVDCTAFRVKREYADDEPIPIGKACRNMEVMLLDDEMKPVNHGEPGEICVRGIGLALGYFNDSKKTEDAFVQNPFNPYYPDRIYKTGDIGKLDNDGNIIYLCRKDGQIKHMGYRIEMGEIETAVSSVNNVESCACIFDGDADYIICCVQSNSNEVTPAYLAESIKNKLPKYMTPNVWKVYRKLPSNANGKIDRVKLKEEYFNGKN